MNALNKLKTNNQKIKFGKQQTNDLIPLIYEWNLKIIKRKTKL